ncbi:MULTISPECIES: alpha/beta hydrolase domain-containing protein [unclassified Mycobacterium]|uniref:alpha/beta hydrolase domain-containing protein n=1 Tax=unclassified Mycobacterium TaxID=2642494 RepID=UPI0029C769DE|nr:MULTISPECIES: alpha/beta hydrolase domain-containing protein [unclassified Mycobacterium]
MTDPKVSSIAGVPSFLLGAYDIATLGYRAEEFFVSGTASSYAPVGTLGSDGHWDVVGADAAAYTTRIVALTPEDDAAFNGTVVVEWLNVSGGIDAPAFWSMAHREIVRAGYAYVGVSAQRVGIDGGGLSLGFDMSLKTQNPERYSSLNHPGDAFAYDIFTQVGRLVWEAEDNGVLGELNPEIVLAVGESQSAIFLTTYVNAVDPLEEVYDGYLVHSRFGPAAPLDGDSLLDESGAASTQPVRFRDDLRAPTLAFITETDLVGALVISGYYPARQPDYDFLRVWEVPGSAHADNYTIQVGFIDNGLAPLDDIVKAYAPTNVLMGQQLSHFINFAPQHHYVLQAALAALLGWVRTGKPAPTGPQLAVTESEPLSFTLDANGIAEGGIRTPWVDVPVANTSGIGSGETEMAALFGSGEVFDAATLQRLYPGGVGDYLERFTSSLDQAIAAGFLVAADRAEILQLAEATFPQG